MKTKNLNGSQRINSHKKIFILFIIILNVPYTFSQTDEKCNSLKKGTFLLMDSVHGNTLIVRNRKTQIEYGEISKLKLKLKIVWKDDCIYSLKLLKVISNPNNIIVPKTYLLTAEIIEVSEYYYVVRSLTSGNPILERRINIIR